MTGTTDWADLEHLPSALTVGRRDDGCVYVEEPAVLEELVRGEGETVANAGEGGDGVRADAEVNLLSEELHRDLLLADGVDGGVTPDEPSWSQFEVERTTQGARWYQTPSRSSA